MSRMSVPVALIAVVGLSTPLLAVHAQSAHAQSAATTVQHEADVAWAKFKGAWTQTKGEAKEQWGKLTDDDITEIDGRREVLIGKLQTRYAISHEEAERQVGAFEALRH